MIKLTHLHKYYNKSKQNQIHVINDTSLVFPEKGLVALTGPSGCGKTTLLNVIGGLDKFDSGTIDFDGQIISSYKPTQWDLIRNASVGYIFQNYNLVEDKTVYENIAIALNMAGLYGAEAIEERINYVLKSVGMYNYRRRNVLALSGGQQQRVAIARAIAKNPKVVLADEPTGNLDANNTFEIMSIIKKISQTCLVILVSHERELVDFYADRVIEILDGKVVKDYENAGNRTLEHIDDRNIYLKDLSVKSTEDVVALDYYYAEEPLFATNLKLIYLNNTLYVKAEGTAKIKYLTDESEIKLIDDHYKKPETDDISTYLFDLNQFGEIKNDSKRKSFIRLRDTLKAGFIKFLNGRKLIGRFFLVVCFVVACTVVFNLARISALTKESAFLKAGRDFIQVEIEQDMTYQTFLTLLADTGADSIIAPYSGQSYTFRYENYYQGSGTGAVSVVLDFWSSISPVPVSVNQADTSVLVEGRLPLTNQEVAIDLWIADQLLASSSFANMGITSYAELIDVQLVASTNDVLGGMVIVGIVKTDSPVIILTDANRFYFNSVYERVALGSALGRYELVEGAEIAADDEILVSTTLGLQVGDIVSISETNCEVVGLFSEESGFSTIVSNETFQKLTVTQQIAEGYRDPFTDRAQVIYLYASDPTTAVAQITALEYVALDTYQFLKQQNMGSVFQQLIFVYIGLAGTLIYIVFMMRSSMLARIKEIGIYRSIGATKRDIYKIFLSEIFAFTSLGSLTGYLFMTYVVYFIQSKLDTIPMGLATVFYFPIQIFFLGLLGVYLLNIIFGMIPIFMLLRKTPSEINTKYDI
jgi:putative ABC transport system permease protein